MCHFQVLWALELFGGSVAAELRNPASVVAQAELQSWELRNLSKALAQAELRNPRSCASRVAQSWKLCKQSCAFLGVAQVKFRHPSCAIRPKSCTILVAQSGEVAESDFIRTS